MAKITINSTDVQLPPLSWQTVKNNKPTVAALIADGQDGMTSTESAVAFLELSAPGLDFDACPPSAIQAAAVALYRATFYRPDESTPAPANA